MSRLITKILTPSETTDGVWVAAIEGWHVKATDRSHAERIIDIAGMCFNVGRKDAQADIRQALGMNPFGAHVPR